MNNNRFEYLTPAEERAKARIIKANERAERFARKHPIANAVLNIAGALVLAVFAWAFIILMACM